MVSVLACIIVIVPLSILLYIVLVLFPVIAFVFPAVCIIYLVVAALTHPETGIFIFLFLILPFLAVLGIFIFMIRKDLKALYTSRYRAP
jgi:hypothetical protein